MGEALERSALDRWRTEPTAFITEVMRNPEDGKPFELFPAQSEFLHHACARTEDGRLLYPEQALGAIKKTGKTVTAAMHKGKFICSRRLFDQVRGSRLGVKCDSGVPPCQIDLRKLGASESTPMQ